MIKYCQNLIWLNTENRKIIIGVDLFFDNNLIWFSEENKTNRTEMDVATGLLNFLEIISQHHFQILIYSSVCNWEFEHKTCQV